MDRKDINTVCFGMQAVAGSLEELEHHTTLVVKQVKDKVLQAHAAKASTVDCHRTVYCSIPHTHVQLSHGRTWLRCIRHFYSTASSIRQALESAKHIYGDVKSKATRFLAVCEVTS